ncbi:MAG: terminase family protein [Candidatus Gastranaerophilales bacterium]|nr:terminase family protein [Candidatus Gastranaerophilales bacterium]
MDDITQLFLPFQKRWLLDTSRFKLAKKSRRTGFTWIQAFEDVKDATTMKVRNKHLDVWFTSSNSDNAKEYIIYCKDWATTLNAGFLDLGEVLIDEEKGIKALSLEFNNGARINGLSSNPAALRGKGGKLVIDEFAFHKDQKELWKAGKPVVTWGYPLRIISSLNGANNLFYHFLTLIEKGKLNWSLHEVDIFKAVNEGLVDKIYGRKTTEEERLEWLKQEKESSGDDVTWLQEYCCVAVDEATSFITYELINSCIEETLQEGLNNITGDIYIGYDVARINDLSVVSIFEKCGSVFYLRKLLEFKNVKFKDQKQAVLALLSHPKTRRMAIDETGIGKQMAEELKDEFGSRMVEPINFSLKTKEELAYKLLYAFQDRNIRIPDDEAIKNDLHSVRRLQTNANIVRFDADRSATDGHADRFWSFALAIFAGTNEPYQKPVILSAKPNIYKEFNTINLRGFN